MSDNLGPRAGVRGESKVSATWEARRSSITRLVRYSTVSLVSTVTSLGTLAVLVGMGGLPAAASNVVATCIGTVPSFELNRRWVWTIQRRRSLWGQVVPFASLSLAGLVISTVTVGLVGAHTTGWSRLGHTAAIEAANVSSYGSLWVIQYLLLNRFLFAPPRAGTAVAGDGQQLDGSTGDHQRALSPVGGGPRRLPLGAEGPEQCD